RFHSYLLVVPPEGAAASEVERRLRRIPGIAYFAPVTVTPPDMAAMIEAALALADGVITPETTFRIETSRGNKQFPLTSPEIDRQIGGEVQEATGAPVDLSNPDVTLNLQIY